MTRNAATRPLPPCHPHHLAAPGAIAQWTPGAPLPGELLILPWGDLETANGPLRLNHAAAAAIRRNQADLAHQRVPLDFEHSSEPTSPTYRGEPVHVAAYGTVEVRPDAGVFLTNLQWTPEGIAHAHDYADLSPVVAKTAANEVTFVKSAALCRVGAIHALTFHTATTNSQTTSTNPANIMDPRLLLIQLLQLPETATDQEIQAAADAAMQDEAGEPAIAEAEPAKAKADPAKPVMAMMSARLRALEARLDTTERDALLATAAGEGKLIPATYAAKLDTSALRQLIAETPATVPVTRHTPATLQPVPASPRALDADEQAICSKLNITPAAYLAANP